MVGEYWGNQDFLCPSNSSGTKPVTSELSNRFRGSSSSLDNKIELDILTLLIVKDQEKTRREKQVASCCLCSGKRGMSS